MQTISHPYSSDGIECLPHGKEDALVFVAPSKTLPKELHVHLVCHDAAAAGAARRHAPRKGRKVGRLCTRVDRRLPVARPQPPSCCLQHTKSQSVRSCFLCCISLLLPIGQTSHMASHC